MKRLFALLIIGILLASSGVYAKNTQITYQHGTGSAYNPAEIDSKGNIWSTANGDYLGTYHGSVSSLTDGQVLTDDSTSSYTHNSYLSSRDQSTYNSESSWAQSNGYTMGDNGWKSSSGTSVSITHGTTDSDTYHITTSSGSSGTVYTKPGDKPSIDTSGSVTVNGDTYLPGYYSQINAAGDTTTVIPSNSFTDSSGVTGISYSKGGDVTLTYGDAGKTLKIPENTWQTMGGSENMGAYSNQFKVDPNTGQLSIGDTTNGMQVTQTGDNQYKVVTFQDGKSSTETNVEGGTVDNLVNQFNKGKGTSQNTKVSDKWAKDNEFTKNSDGSGYTSKDGLTTLNNINYDESGDQRTYSFKNKDGTSSTITTKEHDTLTYHSDGSMTVKTDGQDVYVPPKASADTSAKTTKTGGPTVDYQEPTTTNGISTVTYTKDNVIVHSGSSGETETTFDRDVWNSNGGKWTTSTKDSSGRSTLTSADSSLSSTDQKTFDYTLKTDDGSSIQFTGLSKENANEWSQSGSQYYTTSSYDAKTDKTTISFYTTDQLDKDGKPIAGEEPKTTTTLDGKGTKGEVDTNSDGVVDDKDEQDVQSFTADEEKDKEGETPSEKEKNDNAKNAADQYAAFITDFLWNQFLYDEMASMVQDYCLEKAIDSDPTSELPTRAMIGSTPELIYEETLPPTNCGETTVTSVTAALSDPVERTTDWGTITYDQDYYYQIALCNELMTAMDYSVYLKGPGGLIEPIASGTMTIDQIIASQDIYSADQAVQQICIQVSDASIGTNGLSCWPELSTATTVSIAATKTLFTGIYYYNYSYSVYGGRDLNYVIYFNNPDVLNVDLGVAYFGQTVTKEGPAQVLPTDYKQICAKTDDPNFPSSCYEFTYVDVNDAPVLNAIPALSANEDQEFFYAATATDPENNELYYYTDSLIFNIDTTTGEIRFTPSDDMIGTWNFTVSVTDGLLTDSKNATITILNTNDAPSMTGGQITLAAGSSTIIDLSQYVTDIDNSNADMHCYYSGADLNFQITYNQVTQTAVFTTSTEWTGPSAARFDCCDLSKACGTGTITVVKG